MKKQIILFANLFGGIFSDFLSQNMVRDVYFSYDDLNIWSERFIKEAKEKHLLIPFILHKKTDEENYRLVLSITNCLSVTVVEKMFNQSVFKNGSNHSSFESLNQRNPDLLPFHEFGPDFSYVDDCGKWSAIEVGVLEIHPESRIICPLFFGFNKIPKTKLIAPIISDLAIGLGFFTKLMEKSNLEKAENAS